MTPSVHHASRQHAHIACEPASLGNHQVHGPHGVDVHDDLDGDVELHRPVVAGFLLGVEGQPVEAGADFFHVSQAGDEPILYDKILYERRRRTRAHGLSPHPIVALRGYASTNPTKVASYNLVSPAEVDGL